MMASARSKNASMTFLRRSQQRWSRLKALCQALVRSACQRHSMPPAIPDALRLLLPTNAAATAPSAEVAAAVP
jgi:hypothetical protein